MKTHRRKTSVFSLVLGKRWGLFLSQLFIFLALCLGLEIQAPYWEEKIGIIPLYPHPGN